jgi:hypothetical protein
VKRGPIVAAAIAAGAVAGLTIFGVLVSRAVTVEHAEAPEALRRFAAIRASLGQSPPLLTLDDSGNVLRRTDPPVGSPVRPNRLAVLAYQANERRPSPPTCRSGSSS